MDASTDADGAAGEDAAGAGGSGGAAGTGGSGGAAGTGGSGGSGGAAGTGGSGGAGGSGPGCMECAEEASCEQVDGSARCVCPDDLVDVEGDGSQCAEPCSIAGCHAEARCTAEGVQTDCQCVSPYIGDGEDCALDTECMLLDCDDNAECVVTGAERACRCLSGYEGSGTSCSDIDDCAGMPCENGGVCTDAVNGYDCACAVGYSGETCAVDSCDPSPCPSGFSCSRTAGGPVCTPPCGSECELGDACLEDTHCAGGLTCEPEDGVCVGPCVGAPITSAADLADFRYCTAIDGDLTIESASAAFTTIAAGDLPYLTTIDGSLLVGEIDDTPLVSMTMGALQRITGLLRVQAQPGMALIAMPALTEVGTTAGSSANGVTIAQGTTGALVMPELTTVNGGLSFGLSSLDSIDLRRLTTVNGALSFGDFPSPLVDIDLRALATVTGNLTARYLFSVPFSDVSRLTTPSVTVGGTRTVAEIGCCFINSSSSLSYMCGGTFDEYQSFCD